MNKLRQKKQQILRFLFGSFSVTALMFTFQACYGMPNNFFVEGTVVSETTGQPIPEIRVYGHVNSGIGDVQKTDTYGHFLLQLEMEDSVEIHLRDEDGEKNGQYVDFDTVMSVEAFEQPHLFKMKEKSVE